MMRNQLFWRFFFSILATVLLAAWLSTLFEGYLRKAQSEERIDDTVEALVGFRDALIIELLEDDIEEVVTQLKAYPEYAKQILIFDSYDNELFGRKSLSTSTFLSHFYRSLVDDFRERGVHLQTQITSHSDEVYLLSIQPTLFFKPWLSPRFAGTLMRTVLFVLISAIVCFWLTRTLTRRIRTLQHATRQIKLGNYTTAFADDMRFSNDELGQLGEDFYSMANQLGESEHARKQMLSDISHELRSPLARMQVALAIARDRFPDAEQEIDRIDKESQQMNTLIGSILRIQQLQMQRQVNRQSVNMIELLQGIVDDAKYEYQDQKQLNLSLTKEELWIQADETSLSSACENIIRNALSHAKQSVSVVLSDDKNNIIINVTDDGGGIDSKDASRIFAPFVRLDSSRNRKTGGYGLGLAIAKAVVDHHEGHIQAENEVVNNEVLGLCVTITLPKHCEVN